MEAGHVGKSSFEHITLNFFESNPDMLKINCFRNKEWKDKQKRKK